MYFLNINNYLSYFYDFVYTAFAEHGAKVEVSVTTKNLNHISKAKRHLHFTLFINRLFPGWLPAMGMQMSWEESCSRCAFAQVISPNFSIIFFITSVSTDGSSCLFVENDGHDAFGFAEVTSSCVSCVGNEIRMKP